MTYQPKGDLQKAVLRHLAEQGPTFEDELVRALGRDALAVRGALTCCRQAKAITRTVEVYGNGTGWLYALAVPAERACYATGEHRPAVLFLQLATTIHGQRDHIERVRMIEALSDEAIGPVLSWLHHQATVGIRCRVRPSTPEIRRLERQLVGYIESISWVQP